MLIPLTLIFAYLLGSISSSVLTARAFGLPDPRTVGSKNAGATNMLRIGGRKVASITLIVDILKGVIPIVVATLIGFNLEELALVGFVALLGHIFPVFFGFRGGKGVATFIGVLLAIHLYSGLVFVAIWLFSAKVLKISSLSALIATLLTPFYFYFFNQNLLATIIITLCCVLIFAKHKDNITRLLHKEEDNINA